MHRLVLEAHRLRIGHFSPFPPPMALPISYPSLIRIFIPMLFIATQKKVACRSTHWWLFYLSVPWLAAQWHARAFRVENESWSTGLKNIQLVKKDEDDDSTGPTKLDYDSLYCIALHCNVSYGILWYLIVSNSIARFCTLLRCWYRRAGCVSQDTYILQLFSTRKDIFLQIKKVSFIPQGNTITI